MRALPSVACAPLQKRNCSASAPSRVTCLVVRQASQSYFGGRFSVAVSVGGRGSRDELLFCRVGGMDAAELFPMSKTKILIVDDDARLSTLMRTILERGGYEAREENRSFAALATARGFRPDLVLLDVDMPGKDGGTRSEERRVGKECA